MADQTNQNQGGTIDLRNQQAGQTSGAGSTASQTAAGQSVFNKFEIPESVRQQYPELIPLILETESMTDEERQYWFQILPIMTDEQVGKLREILLNEKKQLEQIDKEYQQEIKQINAKHVSEWKAFEAKEKRQKLQTAESQAEQTEAQTEEELLKKLQQT